MSEKTYSLDNPSALDSAIDSFVSSQVSSLDDDGLLAMAKFFNMDITSSLDIKNNSSSNKASPEK